ncbi:Transcriptional regulator [Myxococcus hansupus]|uniref:Transcriptional regulator n=1 Tax=Pseudomyxococcus hansupus TaxID=1297742 RepID=A0A0H4WWL6_9BACT|nr:cupin domain-containing protein [Myxococcus hansupus]AKQ65740.1 Transcriptional regulator [Myxococcus hansupus]
MKLLGTALVSLPLLGVALAQAGNRSDAGAPSPRASQPLLHVTRSGAQPSAKGPAENFTGTVRVDPLFPARAPARTSGALVTFEPGARSAWHTHPLGQTLVVTSGLGRVQAWGGAVEEIRPGDVVWIPPGQKHWHGASPTTAMSHMAIQEALDGKVVEWMEKVSDAQYAVHPGAGGAP